MTETAGATRRLSAWVASSQPGDLSAADRRLVAMVLLDYLRATAIGSRSATSKATLAAARALGGAPQSTVMVFGDRTDAARAALVNGSLAHATDIDDTHVAAMLHPGASVIPAAFAVAESVGASGEDLALAIAAGYEVAVRVSLSVQPAHFRRGFQATGTCGVFGAAAATARLLGAGPEEVAGALGVAGSMSGALAQFYYSGSDVKRVHAGLAAHNGVVASLLAHNGIHGPHDVLEGEAGFGKAYADGIDEDVLLRGLGGFQALGEVILKPHATSARLQSATEATMAIASAEIHDPADIESVDVGIPEVIAGRLTRPDPPDLTAAQMSLPFTLAVVIVAAHDRGRPPAALVGADYEEYLGDGRVRALAQRVNCRVDDEVSRITLEQGYVPAEVSVSLRDGRRPTRSVSVPSGSVQRPIEPAEHRELFRAAVDGLMSDDATQAVVEAVDNLDEPTALATIARSFVRVQQTELITEGA
jgi:2-methylcitrate dehydratase PrpD